MTHVANWGFTWWTCTCGAQDNDIDITTDRYAAEKTARQHLRDNTEPGQGGHAIPVVTEPWGTVEGNT